MRGDLIINGKDAYDTWGVRMGEGFLDALLAPSQMKEYIQNKSRLEHGKRIVVETIPKQDARSLTLQFTIDGKNREDFIQKQMAFFSELYKVAIEIKVPAIGEQVYKLLYTGKSVSYDIGTSRTFAKIASKFEEANPNNRN